MNPNRIPRAGALIVTAALTLGCGPAASAPAGSAPTESPILRWSDCDDGLQCASLTVPVDWREPDGPTAELELARLPAIDPVRNHGSMVVNFGGPSTTIGVLRVATGLVDGLRRTHDVMAMDPRGLGERGYVRCPPPRPLVPRGDLDRQGWEAFAAANAQWDAACRAAGDPLAEHLNSWQVAHDLDAVRGALGEPELNYFGNSTGSLYGIAYAELFGPTIGRMVLDSVVDHSGPDIVDQVEPVARATEEMLARFARWCADLADCALHGTDALAVFDELLAAAPLPAPSAGTTVDANRLRRATQEAMSGPPFEFGLWPALAEALDGARRGDAVGLVPPDRSGDPPGIVSVYTQSVCGDMPFDASYDSVADIEGQLRAVAPRIGWTVFRSYYGVNYGECAGVQLTDSYPLGPIDAAGAPPVLIVHGTLDTSTPVEGARTVAAQLPGSALLTAEAGHAVYLRGNRCVQDRVHRFVDDGTLPPPDTACPFEAPSAPPG